MGGREQDRDGQSQQDGEGLGEPGSPAAGEKLPREIGGQSGPEPTRYGDWEKNGRCTDF